MCRLLGASFRGPGSPARGWLDAFADLADTGIVSAGSAPGHRDGWGIGGIVDGTAVRFARHEGSMRADPARVDAAWRAIASRHPEPWIAHLRKASPGLAVSEANTHPFWIGDALFCHNGSIRHPARLPLHDPSVLGGTTDSERWFAFLLEQCGPVPPDRFVDALAEVVRASRTLTSASAWNFLLARGPRLYVYHDSPEDPAAHELLLGTAGDLTLACSEPLAPAGVAAPHWESLAQRELAVLERGVVVLRRLV